MGVIVFISILVMLIVIALSLPIAYEVSFGVDEPVHFNGKLHWFGHAFYYEWAYQDGSRPKKTYYFRWKKQTMQPSEATPAATAVFPSNNETEKENLVTYDQVKDASLNDETIPPIHWKDHFAWWPYIMNRAFGQAFFSFFGKLISHSRIRQLQLTGHIGLAAPHETGWLAAVLYTIMPGSCTELIFNYTEEEYQFQGYANGHLYPAVLLIYTASFISAKPARDLLGYWLKTRKENSHGQ